VSADISVVIPSRSLENLVRCVEEVRRREPGMRVIWVDDRDEHRGRPNSRLFEVERIEGIKPFIFARNVNLGIVAAGDDDVVVLNDDALLSSPGGFRLLQHEAERDRLIGIIGATTDVTGQPLQYQQAVGLRRVPHFAFVCVFIPRRTIKRIGMLDERYSLDYGCEDRDYCQIVESCGYRCYVHDGCFVDHSSMTSSYRGHPLAPRDFSKNKILFDQKWGAGVWDRV
jgi:GT2 family glycosyltransferase